MKIRCENCGENKEHYALGLCKSCYRKEYYRKNRERELKNNAKWRDDNKEKMLNLKKQWKEKYPEKHKEHNRKYRSKHSTRRNEYMKKYRITNKEYTKKNNKKWRMLNSEYQRKWKKNNPNKIREYWHKRRLNGTIKKGIINKIVNENIFKYGTITCEKCKKECEDDYHIDHITPVSKGGGNNYENLQVLYSHCNVTKHSNIVDYRKKITNKQLYIQEMGK